MTASGRSARKYRPATCLAWARWYPLRPSNSSVSPVSMSCTSQGGGPAPSHSALWARAPSSPGNRRLLADGPSSVMTAGPSVSRTAAPPVPTTVAALLPATRAAARPTITTTSRGTRRVRPRDTALKELTNNRSGQRLRGASGGNDGADGGGASPCIAVRSSWTRIARSSKMSAGFTGIRYYSSTGRYVLDLASKMGARCHAATTRIVSRAHLR
eukprot:COSAG01_NODE_1880_length_8993_cov_60.775916_10_plen_214_part_00